MILYLVFARIVFGFAEPMFYRWYNTYQAEENLRMSAWKEGRLKEKDSFQSWINRCTTKIEKGQSLYKLRHYDASRLKGLCFNPLNYRIRARKCREVVGLMSIEGHGNHAVRWVLEQVTGIASASI